MDTHITIPMARLIELETAEHERDILRTDNAKLAREAHTWSKAAEVYAADAERYRWLRQRYNVLCRMHTAQGLGLDLSTVYVRSAEQFDGVIDAAMAPHPVLGGA